MNGMQRKAEAKRHAAQWTESGLPRDPNAWTEEDWRDLNEAMETVTAKIAERHKDDGPGKT